MDQHKNSSKKNTKQYDFNDTFSKNKSNRKKFATKKRIDEDVKYSKWK
jgi:hypothetical protein